MGKTNQCHRNLKFPGLARYYQRFIWEFSQIVIPLTKLTRKGVPFVWDAKCEDSFWLLKEKLTTAPVLVISDPTENF
jgi:hypothetical protein